MILILRQTFGKKGSDMGGFTMLEVLVAITLLSITILPLLGLITGMPFLHAQREQQMRAAFLAQKRLEEVKHSTMANFTNSSGTGNFLAPDIKFRYTYLVAGFSSDIKPISVTVWYDEDGDNTEDGNEQSVTLNDRVARRR